MHICSWQKMLTEELLQKTIWLLVKILNPVNAMTIEISLSILCTNKETEKSDIATSSALSCITKHILEHMAYEHLAVKEWLEILK